MQNFMGGFSRRSEKIPKYVIKHTQILGILLIRARGCLLSLQRICSLLVVTRTKRKKTEILERRCNFCVRFVYNLCKSFLLIISDNQCVVLIKV